MRGDGDAGGWRPDVLGEPFEQLTLPLGEDDEGAVEATLVRYRPGWTPRDLLIGAAENADVLYVHGWSDYFFQRQLADFWHRSGARFHALDLRKYGRSLRPHQTPGFVTDLATYDEDIEAALDAMRQGRGDVDRRERRPLVLMGHSTGGLTLSLWAARNPGRASALVLNSPWLEFQASGAVRQAVAPLLRAQARLRPRATMRAIDPGFYTRTVSSSFDGAWDYDFAWRPERGFPVHPAWLAAILAGHATIAAGVDVAAPVLTLLSTKSALVPWWTDEMASSDVALDVETVAQRALRLGRVVSVVRLERALHDVMLSAPEVRATAYTEMTRWLRAYL